MTPISAALTQADRDAVMDAVVSEMGQRFARKPRKAKSQEGTVKSGEATV